MTPPEVLRARLSTIISPYVPELAIEQVVNWIMDYKVKLSITGRRQSVYGDYRNPDSRIGHRISINEDLNKYAFLITFVHEMAHLVVWEKHRNAVRSHGQEWKSAFKQLMIPVFERQIFPEDVNLALRKYMSDPAASSCSDVLLTKSLARYNAKPVLHLEDLTDGELFSSGGRIFKRESKIRTRYRCIELKTKTVYLFSPIAEVKRVKNESL
jgi:SprT protein